MSRQPEWNVPHTLLAAVIQWLDEEETGGHGGDPSPPASFPWEETPSARPRRTRDALIEARMGKELLTVKPAKRRPRRSAPRTADL